MYMTKGEIIRSYRQAKRPLEQVQILADLNACTAKTIKNILSEAGVYRSLADSAMRLYQQGLYDREIAEIIGVSVTTVGKWRSKNNLMSNRVKKRMEK